jgi:hypothetical protein
VRRRFGFVKGKLTSFEDEHLSRGEQQAVSRILLEEIEQPRVGPIRDIVATIQPEQDKLGARRAGRVDLRTGSARHRKPQPRNLAYFSWRRSGWVGIRALVR